jgi:hypothetical protein
VTKPVVHRHRRDCRTRTVAAAGAVRPDGWDKFTWMRREAATLRYRAGSSCTAATFTQAAASAASSGRCSLTQDWASSSVDVSTPAYTYASGPSHRLPRRRPSRRQCLSWASAHRQLWCVSEHGLRLAANHRTSVSLGPTRSAVSLNGFGTRCPNPRGVGRGVSLPACLTWQESTSRTRPRTAGAHVPEPHARTTRSKRDAERRQHGRAMARPWHATRKPQDHRPQDQRLPRSARRRRRRPTMGAQPPSGCPLSNPEWGQFCRHMEVVVAPKILRMG